MLLLPIRTENSVRHAPLANVGLIGVNVLIFILIDFAGTSAGLAFKERHFIFDGESPKLYQLVTYQFAHADTWHLLGNMLFLWVFGNGVNAKMGDLPYGLFYVAGGMFAGLAFGWGSNHALLGASGSIAAVTTAYLVLFPRSRVTVLYFFFFIGFIEVPATIIIGIKIVLWDNVLAPQIGLAGSQVAHSAHLGGYVFGFVAAMVMLLVRAVPRDQFDMLALLKRWNQRRGFAAVMNDPRAQAQAQYGRVARVAPADPTKRAEWDRQMDERTERRARIGGALRDGDLDGALREYEKLVAADPAQCLPADQQLAVGREYYARGRSPQAAATFERYLATYRTSPEANEVRLLLGIIHARDLRQFDAAEAHLKEALARATSPVRREQAQHWLDDIRARRGDVRPT